MRTTVVATMLFASTCLSAQPQFSWNDTKAAAEHSFIRPSNPQSPLDLPSQFNVSLQKWVNDESISHDGAAPAFTYFLADLTSDLEWDVVTVYRFQQQKTDKYFIALFENQGDDLRFKLVAASAITPVDMDWSSMQALPRATIVLTDKTSPAKRMIYYRSGSFVEETSVKTIEAMVMAAPVVENWCSNEMQSVLASDWGTEVPIRAMYDLHPFDVDADGDIDVIASCIVNPYGGNAYASYLVLFSSEHGRLKYSSVARVGGRGERGFADDPNFLSMNGKTLVVRSVYWKKKDGMCCPSGQTIVHYSAKSGSLVEVP